MKIVDRYIFYSFSAIFSFCLVFLCILYIVGDIFGFLDEILRERIGIVSLVSFYFYMLPFVTTQIAPISGLLASVFILGNLNRHNEITALGASGVSLYKIIRPMLAGALVIGTCVFLINDRIVPNSMRLANKIRYEKLEIGKQGSSQSIFMRNIALYGSGNKIIFAKKFDIKKYVLEDIIIHGQDVSQNITSKISAKYMRWNGITWLGEDIVIYNIDRNGQFLENPKIFKEKEIMIKETPLDFINNQWQPQYMGYMQLKKYLNAFLSGSKLAYRRFTVDLHYKLAFPFSPLVMILIAAPFTIITLRGKELIGMARGILIALSYIPIVAIGLALGKGGILPPIIAAWSANIILGVLGAYLTLKH